MTLTDPRQGVTERHLADAPRGGRGTRRRFCQIQGPKPRLAVSVKRSCRSRDIRIVNGDAFRPGSRLDAHSSQGKNECWLPGPRSGPSQAV